MSDYDDATRRLLVRLGLVWLVCWVGAIVCAVVWLAGIATGNAEDVIVPGVVAMGTAGFVIGGAGSITVRAYRTDYRRHGRRRVWAALAEGWAFVVAVAGGRLLWLAARVYPAVPNRAKESGDDGEQTDHPVDQAR